MANPNPSDSDKLVKAVANVKVLLSGDRFKQDLAKALPKHCNADRQLRVMLTTLNKTPKLALCTQESLFTCLLSCSQFGLEPDGRSAHLIPFWSNKLNSMQCQLIVDYKGIAELVMRSGLVSYIHADKVCENDDFHYNKGQVDRHIIDWKKPRGPAYCYYALVRFKDGTEKCDVMNLEEIEAIRRRSKSPDEGPWKTDYTEMAKKTVFRRLSKWAPWSAEVKDAIDSDLDEEIAAVVEEKFRTMKVVREEKPPATPALPAPDPTDGTGGDDHPPGLEPGKESTQQPAGTLPDDDAAEIQKEIDEKKRLAEEKAKSEAEEKARKAAATAPAGTAAGQQRQAKPKAPPWDYGRDKPLLLAALEKANITQAQVCGYVKGRWPNTFDSCMTVDAIEGIATVPLANILFKFDDVKADIAAMPGKIAV